MANTNKQKTTYANKEQRQILVLKEAFLRDLGMFTKLLEYVPQEWTLTVITDGDHRELVVNVPAKKK